MQRTKVRSREAAKAAAEDAVRLLKDVHIYLTNSGRYASHARLPRRVQYAAERVRLVVDTLPR